MIWGKVVAEEMIVDGGTHEDDSYFWELSDDSFDG